MNKLPLAEFSYTPSSIGPGISVTVDASASYDPEGWPLRYHWEFGDGSAANTTSTSIQHTYSASQTFVVTLTVTDVRGGMSSQSQALKVGFAPVAL
ncbi:MAG: PKD domain-containing protein, partial [Methanobacteriota archaeon]